MTFNNPSVLLLLFFIPLYLYFKLHTQKEAAMKFSNVEQAKKIRPSLTIKLRHIPLWIRSLVFVFIITALARPQKGIEHTKMPTEGIDIILALDVSTSMYAEDFTLNGKSINRLAVIKPIVKEFIKDRTSDQIGMIVFAGRPYTQCPLTLDYGILSQFLDKVEIGMVEDGTAIGSAIATCINRLKGLPGKSKIVILLTDGRNNMGKIDPLTAAEMAKTMGVKIYTIGAGAKGLAPYPVMDPFGNKTYTRISVDIDEDTLKQIAQITSGMYFRATDTEGLREIYKQIDQMEKTKIEVKIYMEYKELFPYFLIPGLFLLILEIIISNTWLRKIP